MLAGYGAALRLGALAQSRAGESAGAQRHLCLVLLPVDALVVRVYGRVVRRKYALLLIVLEEVRPGYGYHGRDGRKAQDEPVDAHADHEHHYGEDEEVHQRAAQVAGRDDDDAEHDYEVPRELRHREEAVEVAPGLEVHHVLGHDDDKGQLYDLCGLYAYAGEAQPAVVARGLVALAEEYQQHKQKRAGRVQPLPVLGEDVEVYYRDYDIRDHTYHYGQPLDYDELRRVVIVLRRAPDDHEAVERADKAHCQQQHVRAAEKFLYMRQKLLRTCHLALLG